MANLLTDGDWERAPHLDYLSERLVDVAAGRCKRLIITMPPQNGKSSLVSHWFIVWFLNLFANRRVVFVSYGAEYAESWGRRVRNSIEAHPEALSVRMASDSGAAGDWETTEGGGMLSVGIGGSVTGRRADLLIFDDPIKNAEEASSEVQRKKVWEFFQSAAYTRLTPEGAVIVIMTRWHEDDLVGRLNKEESESGEVWERVDLPAIAEEKDQMGREPGKPLWSERWPISALNRIKRAVGSYFWNALYQQRPAPPEGNYFKRAWFKVVEANRVPEIVNMVRSWDLAATAQGENGNEDPDWLAGCRMGVDGAGKYYIWHMARERLSPDGVERVITQTAASDGTMCKVRVEQEGAASGKIVKHHYTHLLDGYDCRFVSVNRTSKFTRSGPFNAACERGDVFLVAGPWITDFMEELAAFPNGSHDDQVDAAVGAYSALTQGPKDFSEKDWQKVFNGGGDAEKQDIEQRLLARFGRGEGF